MGNRLLLADDSITIQKVVAIIFANEEFELTVVDNGTAALEKAREIQPDVMLVDALMPGKTGYEVCAEIRRGPKLSSVPILLLIGAFEPLDEEKARECGADASISKPFESQQLIDRVKEMLELGRTRASAPAAPPAAKAAAIASAEEIWGELSSFDESPAEPPAAAFPEAEDIWGGVAAEEPPAFQPPAAPEPEPVEASLEDDLWGAFEIEEIPAQAPEPPSELFGVVEPEAGFEAEVEFEAEEFFSFEEGTEGIEETGPALDAEPVNAALAGSEEEFFAFAEEPEAVAKAAPAAEPEPAAFPEYEPLSFVEEPEEAAALEPPPVPQPVAEPAPVAKPTPPPAAEPAPAAQAASLTEEQLVAALSKVSREVIERIVWEVVPDLAEVLIKEEIRKLKSGVRG